MFEWLKEFFAPCLELLVWEEISLMFKLAWLKGIRSFIQFTRMMWWLLPVVIVMFTARAFMLFPELSRTNLVPELANIAPDILVTNAVIALYIVGLCQSLFFFIAVLLSRPSREPKESYYLMSNMNSYFVYSLVLFPLFSWLFSSGIFFALWVLTMHFFVDGKPGLQNLFIALGRGARAYLRFFPVILVLGALLGLLMLGCTLSLVGLGSLVGACAPGLVTAVLASPILLVCALVLGGWLCMLPVLFVPVAVLTVLYIKIINRFRPLFFTEEL